MNAKKDWCSGELLRELDFIESDIVGATRDRIEQAKKNGHDVIGAALTLRKELESEVTRVHALIQNMYL